jgi:hypothetical protein
MNVHSLLLHGSHFNVNGEKSKFIQKRSFAGEFVIMMAREGSNSALRLVHAKSAAAPGAPDTNSLWSRRAGLAQIGRASLFVPPVVGQGFQ